MPDKEDFEIKIASKLDEDTTLVTAQELPKKWLEQAMFKFNNNYHQYSTYLKESSFGQTTITNEELDVLAQNPQSDLVKIIRINNIARYYINKDDLIGKVFETIESNINTEFKLFYKDFSNNRNKQKLLEKAKEVIDNFNGQINLEGLLRKSIPLTYAEGNYPMYLRRNNKDNYIVDYYPLGVVEVSDYEIDGEPYLLFNVRELENRLRKINKKNKNGTSLFFKDIDEEIKNNYPLEVYSAYKSKEQYAKLNIESSGILRINNMNRKYGVTPIFRTFRPASMLETFEATDKINAKSKGKKVIFQKLRKELLGTDGDTRDFEAMAYAHEAFMEAWKNDVVIYTAPAWVEDILYVEPKTENTNINNINYYRSKIMTDLGISFLNSENKSAYASAKISIDELMKMINKITEQLQDVLKKWYKIILQENNIPLIYCPDVQVVDSELLSTELKLQLVEVLYSKLNCSLETAYNMLGVRFEDEKQKRKQENTDKLDEIFKPRLTAYTNSGSNPDDPGGRPQDSNDTDTQQNDMDRRKAKEGI